MQKVYLLLRNNRQSGPYTLEEVLQLNLKPFDLVWVEGRSAAWRYPAEIETLKPYVPETPRPAVPFEPIATEALDKKIESGRAMQASPAPEPAKKIFVSMPGKMSAAPVLKTEPMPAPVPASQEWASHKPDPQPTGEKENLQTSYHRSLDEVENDYTKWVYQQKTSQKPKLQKKDLAVAAGILVLVVVGYLILSEPAIVQPPTAMQAPAREQRPAALASGPATENSSVQTEEDPVAQPPIETPETGKPISRQGTKKPVRSTLPVETAQELPAAGNSSTAARAAEEEVEIKKQERESSPGQAKPEVKKKKLGARIRELFAKKDGRNKDDEDPVAEEEPRPANNRQATRRGNEESDSGQIDMAQFEQNIDLGSDAPDENWMMGLSGVKLTLRNRNGVAIQSATVGVLYYDANNRLIEKKQVRFGNVAASGKATIPIPDHKFADHVEFKLISVVPAGDDRFASN